MDAVKAIEPSYYITWMESDKAEIIEDMLDARNVPIEMLATPHVIRDQVDFVMICKDCFQVLINREQVEGLKTWGFPPETRAFDAIGTLLWEIL